MTLIERYTKAMIAGNDVACLSIEREYGLDGYPPELVSVGLNAIDQGLDALTAIEDYMAQ